MNTIFLDALRGENHAGRPPVWFMRQAGRALPEYRKIREKYPLGDLFHNPEMAAQITKLPVDLLGVDAAILFSDILLIVEAMGGVVQYPETGGVLATLPTQWQKRNVKETLFYVAKAIKLAKPTLKVPLIGFCGGPYTVARYLGRIEPPILDALTDLTIDYLKMQIEAGVEAVQIFDSWAGELSRDLFMTLSWPYLKRIVSAITEVPVILFCRGSCRYAKELAALNPAAISFDWEKDLTTLATEVPMAIQGNLAPESLLLPWDQLEPKVRHLLSSMVHESRYIFNLGHGVLPQTPVDNLIRVVDLIHDSRY
jgi:uroporphyrinogen decarboxylase